MHSNIWDLSKIERWPGLSLFCVLYSTGIEFILLLHHSGSFPCKSLGDKLLWPLLCGEEH